MADYRHSGMGWSNGAIPGGNGNILAFPSPDLLMLGSEHWHYDQAIRAGKRVLFRGMARQGFRPAELKWDVVRYVDEILRDAVRVSEPITDFVGWNELNLQDERGDKLADHGDLTDLFSILGAFQMGVVAELRRRPVLKNARIHFGAWAPKDETDYTTRWRRAAEACDVIDVHAYGHGTGIVGHIEKYRALFPGKPVQITEWHSDGGPVEMDRETLALFANEAAVHPNFRAYYFLFEWKNPPAHQRALADAIAVWGNGDRYGLFLNPPVSTRVPEPTPVPEPETPTMPEPKTRDEVIAISNAVADEVGILRLLLLACGIAESNLKWDARRPSSPDQDEAYWTDVSHGVWQQTVRWSQEYKDWYTNDAPGHPPGQFPGADVTEAAGVHYYDVEHAARVAARQLKAHYRPGEDDAVAKALARYNYPAGDGTFKGTAQEANYRRGIAEARAILGESAPASAVVYDIMTSPQTAGRFAATPKGIILHGSRSGRARNPKDAEYRGTAAWAVNNPNGLAWHATVGENRVAVHMGAREWGWHARSASPFYLGAELAQATVDDPITDAQVDALADWIKTRILPAWPDLPMHFPSHAEVEASGETGARDGKTDAFPVGDARMDDLRNRLYARLQIAQPAPEPEPVPVDLDGLRNLVGNAYHEDGVVVPALAAALANPDDGNLRAQADAVLRWLREHNPDRAA